MTAGCPAASAGVATARCPAVPECWRNMTVMSGAASAESVLCTQSHTWETFAIALMPVGARTFDQPALMANPTVREVCSQTILLRSRQLQARRLPVGSWLFQVLPPSETAFGAGLRTYRCVGAEAGKEPSSSQFIR